MQPPKLSSVATGFVSINCGGPRYKDPTTGIVYEADKYYSGGAAHRVRPPPPSDEDPEPSTVEKTLRVFNLPLSCYMFPVPSGRYLVRLTFLYGNHDNQSSTPQFNVSVGTTNAATVTLDMYYPAVTEIVTDHNKTAGNLPVCFIQWSPFGLPLVNAIELRPLPLLSYPFGDAKQTGNGVLSLFWRLHCGGPNVPYNGTGFSWRYPRDPLDRIWDPDWVTPPSPEELAIHYMPPVQLNSSRPTTVTNATAADVTIGPPNNVPPFIHTVARSVAALTRPSGALRYIFSGLATDAAFQVYLYFPIILPNSSTPGQLLLDILANNHMQYKDFDPAVQGQGVFGAVSTLSWQFNTSSAALLTSWTLDIRVSSLSVIRTPVISGIEIYQIFPMQPSTPPVEVQALRALQASFGNPRLLASWQGNDPCQPVMWSYVKCWDEPLVSTVSGIYLQQVGLLGTIPEDIGNLANLTLLWLNNNNISGSIPDTMGNLSKLVILQIQNNNLSGLVPESLTTLTRISTFSLYNNQLSGPFPFNVSETYTQINPSPGNPNLCTNNTVFTYGLVNCKDLHIPPPPAPPLALPPSFPFPDEPGDHNSSSGFPNPHPPRPLPLPVLPPGAAVGGGGAISSGSGTSSVAIIVSLICASAVALAAVGIILGMCMLKRIRQRRREEEEEAKKRKAAAEAMGNGEGYSDSSGNGTASQGVPLVPYRSGSPMAKENQGGLYNSNSRVGTDDDDDEDEEEEEEEEEEVTEEDKAAEKLLSPFLSSLGANGNTRIRRMTLHELEVATDSFSPGFLIGSGGFGPVYRGILANGTPIAVKKRDAHSDQGTPEFCNELELLSRAQHPHLVSLLGFCVEKGNHILVYEYLSRGTVRDHLYDAAGNPLGGLRWLQRLSIAVGAAKGIEYLHVGLQPSIIHRDVKTSNILLDDNFSAKLADFGLSRLGPDENVSHVSTNVKGTAGYLDPEYYTVRHLTDRSDVFSFGVVLLELISGRQPIDLNRPRAEWNIVDWARGHLQQGRVEAIVDPTLKESADGSGNPAYLLDAMWKVAEMGILCVEPMGVNRPSISDVVRELTEAVAMELQYNRSSGDSNLTFSESPSPPSDGWRPDAPGMGGEGAEEARALGIGPWVAAGVVEQGNGRLEEGSGRLEEGNGRLEEGTAAGGAAQGSGGLEEGAAGGGRGMSEGDGRAAGGDGRPVEGYYSVPGAQEDRLGGSFENSYGGQEGLGAATGEHHMSYGEGHTLYGEDHMFYGEGHMLYGEGHMLYGEQGIPGGSYAPFEEGHRLAEDPNSMQNGEWGAQGHINSGDTQGYMNGTQGHMNGTHRHMNGMPKDYVVEEDDDEDEEAHGPGVPYPLVHPQNTQSTEVGAVVHPQNAHESGAGSVVYSEGASDAAEAVAAGERGGRGEG